VGWVAALFVWFCNDIGGALASPEACYVLPSYEKWNLGFFFKKKLTKSAIPEIGFQLSV